MSNLKSPTLIDHFKSITALPVMVLLVIPYSIWHFTNGHPLFIWLIEFRILFIILGILSFFIGVVLFIASNSMFHKKGKGTLAPWNPPKKLVIYGPYRYVRNPMISGVNLILLGEAFLAPSGYVLLWQIFFFLLNHIVFIYKEEPDLVKRFGADYLEYKKHVPRWIPRWKAWKGND